MEKSQSNFTSIDNELSSSDELDIYFQSFNNSFFANYGHSDFSQSENKESYNSKLESECEFNPLPKDLFNDDSKEQDLTDEETSAQSSIEIDKQSELSQFKLEDSLFYQIPLRIEAKPYIPKIKKPDNSNSKIESNYQNNIVNLYDIHIIQYMKLFKSDKEINSSILNNKISNKNKIKQKRHELKHLKGDWTCFYCKNINFSFRKECNRCKKLKEESNIEYKKAEEKLKKLKIQNF